MDKFCLVFSLFLISLCPISVAQAADLGEPVSVTAFIEFDQEYNDNLYLTSVNEVRELISYIGGGALVEFKTNKNQLDLDYRLRQVFHWDYEDDDGIDTTEEDYLAHNFNLDAATQLTDRLKGGISEFYLTSRRPRDYYLMTNRISRARYWANRVSPYLEYQLGEKLFLMLKYKYDVLRYKDRFVIYDEDSTENRGYLTFKYRFNPREAVDLDYQYWHKDYEILPSYRTHQVTGGYERRFRVVRGEARCGYLTRTWEEEIEGFVKDSQGFVYKISATARTKNSRARLSLEETPSDLTESGSEYRVRMLSGGVGCTLLGKVSVDLGGYYQQFRYQELRVTTASGATEKRSDDTWNVSATIEYPIHEQLSLGLTFMRTERDSNTIDPVSGDFVENRILFTIKPRYEIEW
jgi:predicted porin